MQDCLDVSKRIVLWACMKVRGYVRQCMHVMQQISAIGTTLSHELISSSSQHCMQVPQLVVDDLMADCAQLISEEMPSNLADPRKFARIPLLSLAVRTNPHNPPPPPFFPPLRPPFPYFVDSTPDADLHIQSTHCAAVTA